MLTRDKQVGLEVENLEIWSFPASVLLKIFVFTTFTLQNIHNTRKRAVCSSRQRRKPRISTLKLISGDPKLLPGQLGDIIPPASPRTTPGPCPRSAMESSSSALCVLILLTTTFTTGSRADSTNISVKLNDSATLPCDGRCSGLATWSQNSSGVVAQCNQTSCLSVKEGFNMSHDQYLAGNNSLIIPVVDLSKIGEYTCRCSHKCINNVVLVVSFPPVKVNFHGNATLPCSVNCSGLASWIRSNDDVVAQCNQTLCQSVKAGYQMVHDQYLEGNLSLYITDADFSKRGLYTCECDGTGISDVEFSITALNSTVQIKPGESLLLKLEIPDTVEVLYGAGGSSSCQICTVDGCSLQCSDDYEPRVLFSPALELKGVKQSDSGVYAIRDFRTKEDIHVYTVTIRDDPPNPDKTANMPWLWLSVGVNVVLAAVIAAVIVGLLCRKKSIQCGGDHEMRCVSSGEDSHSAEEQNILPADQQ
ncbi:hypothetical protein AOLI_G00274320 [Acnodon oligacanthus]